MEYSLASNNPFDFPENNKLAPLRTKFSSSSYAERNFNLKSNNIEKEFSSAPNFRDFGKFSDVEYPLTANELWKPNYWNCPNSVNTICENQPIINSNLNHTFTHKGLTSNFKKQCLPESVLSFSTKSYSDPKKNYMMLKNKQINNLIKTMNKSNETLLKNKDSICIKDNYESQKSDIDDSISIYVDKFNNQMISLLKPASGSEILHTKTNLSNVCNNNDFFASDCEAKLKRSENIVNSYTDKFNDEMSAIIKFVADNIVLNNSKCSEENLLGRKETEIHNLNSPKTNIEENSFNIFNPTLKNTENQVQLYADEFNDKMTSIIKTTADKCLSQNIELPMMNYNLQSSNQGINDFDRDYETKFKLFGDSVNSYTDRFNEKITSVLSAKFNDMLFSNLQCPKEAEIHNLNSPKTSIEENSFNIFNPTLKNTENQVQLYADEFNDKMTSIIKTTADKCLSQNIELPMVNYNLQSSNQGINDFDRDYETKFKLFGDSVNSYTDRFNEKITSVLSAKFNDMLFSNLQCPKEAEIHNLNSPKTSIEENSFNIFNPTLKNTENQVKLYADEFNEKMSSIIKTTADKCRSQNIELPMVNYNLQSSNQGINDFDRDYETKFKLFGDSVNSYTDRFNEKITSVLSAKLNDILFGYLQCPKEAEMHNLNSPKANIEENSLNIFNRTLENTENQVKLYADEFNEKMSSIIKTTADKCLSQNIELPMVNYNLQSSNQGINDFDRDYETKFKLFGDSVNSYTDRFNEKITSVLSAKLNDILFENLQCPKEIDNYEKYLHHEESPDSFCQIKQNSTTQEPKININYTNVKSDNPLICNENVKYIESRISDEEKILFENSSKGSENEKQENIDKLKDDTFFSNEEFTTDAYPESDNSGSFYALSTVAPTKSILDANVIIEPEKSLYSDEVEQYFMLV
ncbi:unnamed protein product, partial [Brenthis ino]